MTVVGSRSGPRCLPWRQSRDRVIASRMQPAEYLKLAEVEDRMWYFRALHGRIEDGLTAVLGEQGRILDGGCGTGGLIRRLAARHPGWKWTGIDLDPLAIQLARARVGQAARLVEGSVTSLPFADASFDAATSADVLYHLDDDASAVAEVFRVLKPGGILVVNVPAYPWLWSYHDEAVGGRRRYRRAGVLGLLRMAGCSTVRATHANFGVFPLVVTRRKLLPAPSGGSDVGLQPEPVERVLRGLAALENDWIRDGGGLPFGSSVFALARKPGPPPEGEPG
jgi:SAM-dependent methyltransferase